MIEGLGKQLNLDRRQVEPSFNSLYWCAPRSHVRQRAGTTLELSCTSSGPLHHSRSPRMHTPRSRAAGVHQVAAMRVCAWHPRRLCETQVCADAARRVWSMRFTCTAGAPALSCGVLQPASHRRVSGRAFTSERRMIANVGLNPGRMPDRAMRAGAGMATPRRRRCGMRCRTLRRARVWRRATRCGRWALAAASSATALCGRRGAPSATAATPPGRTW